MRMPSILLWVSAAAAPSPPMDQRLFLLQCSAPLAVLLSIHSLFSPAGAQSIGINWGMKGSNLPSPSQVIALYHTLRITRLRLFEPNAAALTALRSSGIVVVLGTLNDDLSRLASDPAYATSWVATNVIPYTADVQFRCISVGNEVIPSNIAGYVLPAMRNLDAALKAANIKVPVTTAVASNVLGVSYPPSQGRFSDAAMTTMADIAAFLEAEASPLLVNVYPYFSYISNPTQVPLDYALFRSSSVVVQDGSLGYTSLFDAMVDAIYAALEKTGAPGVEVVVSETGWPSGGGDSAATVDNAMTYNNNVVAHVAGGGGTLRRAGRGVEAYLFAMFNEDQKPAGTEQHFGIFQPNMTEVYHVNFSS